MAVIDKKELVRFIVSGVTAVTLDLVSYFLLSKVLDYSVAKGISFVIGTIAAFILNKYWTFEQKEFSTIQLIKFIVLYLLTLSVNIFINDLILEKFEITLLAFLFATGASTVLNFIGQKFWIFNQKK